MEINLVGRVSNLNLPVASALLPVFEAVVNSIQAIEDVSSNHKGKIEIRIRRGDGAQAEMNLGERELRPIGGFDITDNGVGFDENNFKSFETSDSRWKEQRGGKGIGRLFWLKAFDRVDIESQFGTPQNPLRREIKFTLNGVESSPPEKARTDKRYTLVKLSGFKDEYRKACKKRAASIGARIVEHCLIYFLGPNCPEIILTDDDEDEALNLNDWFHQNLGESIVRETFAVKKEKFTVVGLPLFSSEESSGRLHWCSNNREVKNEPLSRLIPNLKGKVKSAEGRNFVFAAYLSGEYLDKNTNAERSAFNIPDEDLPPAEAGSLGIDVGPSQEAIRKGTAEVLAEKLKERIEPIAKEKREQVEKYVADVAPQYRPLISFEPGILDSIPPGLSDDKLDLELHKAHYQLESKLKEQGKEFMQRVSATGMPPDQREKLEKEFFEKISAVNQANLAKYVLSRKSILDIYDSAIKQQADGSFEREDVVHNLVYPRYKTSKEIPFDQHNLWLLDERLAYHHYVASEKRMDQMETIQSESEERPDIVIFNNPTAFGEGGAPYGSIVIVEFKRPGREAYNKDDRDPIQQMLDYVEEIRAGKVRAADGQQFLVPQSIPFFVYLVCDLTDEIRKEAKGRDLRLTADGLGFFGYNGNYEAYIEVMSYKRVAIDARKRNRVFFEKLGIS